MKTFLRVLGSAFLACLLAACPETTVNEDFGVKPSAVDAADWSGSWQAIDDDDVIQFTVTDAQSAVIRMTEPDDKDDEPVEFRLRQAAAGDKSGLQFALITEKDSKPAKTTLHLLRQAEEGILLLWTLDDEAVEAALKAGQLKGTTQRVKNEPHNHLDSDPANPPKLLAPQFWRWTEPAILKRISEKQ